MALSYKFTIFFVFVTVYLAKTQNHENNVTPFNPHFKPYFNNRELFVRFPNKTENPPIERPIPRPIPPSPPVEPKPIYPPNPCVRHSSHVFSFSNVGLQKIGPDFLSSNDIISLHLDNNDINDISPYAFRNVRNLRHLDLSGNKIPKEKMLTWTGNANLLVLIIDDNRDSHNLTKALREYEDFTNLKHLQMRNSQLGSFQIPFYLVAPTLTHLHLSNNSIDSSDVVFDNIPVTLTHLYLNKNSIDRVKEKDNQLRCKCLRDCFSFN